MANVLLLNDFEEGFSGTGISTTNTSGNADNPFDIVSVDSSSSLTFDNTHSAHGGLAMKVALGPSSANAYAVWGASLGAQTTTYARAYLYLSSLPSNNNSIISFWQNSGATSLVDAIELGSNGKFTAGIASGSSTTVMPTNSWVRLEVQITSSVMTLKIFTTMDSSTATETVTFGTQTYSSVNSVGFGPSSGSNANTVLWMDDVAASSTGYVGPVPPIQYRDGSAGVPVASTNTVTVTLPDDSQPGDFVVVAGRQGQPDVTFSTPVGWTLLDSGTNDTAGYSYCFYYRVLQTGDVAPTLASSASNTWSWATAGVYSTLGHTLSLFAQSVTNTTTSSGNSVTPNSIAASAPIGSADLILTVARSASITTPSSFTFTQPTGWTQDSGAEALGNLNSSNKVRYAGVSYQVALPAGSVTPGSESLTDSTSDGFYFSTIHVIVQSATPAPVYTDPQQVALGPAWANRIDRLKRLAVLWDVQPAFAGSYLTGGDIAFGAITVGQQIVLITDPSTALPGPAWFNTFHPAYLSKQNVLWDFRPQFGSNNKANIAFGAITLGNPILLVQDPDTALPGKPFLNTFRFAVTSNKVSVLYDYQAGFAGTYFNPGPPSDLIFGAITVGIVEFFNLPSPPASFPPAWQNAFKGQSKKIAIVFDSPPNYQEIPFGPFCLGGTETDMNLYGGTATDPNAGMGGTEADTNLYGASFTGCHT